MRQSRYQRGNLIQVLNCLVRQGTIIAFRTNLFARSGDDEIVVTVTTPEADELDITWQKVTQALDPLPFDTVVRVEWL
jgi:hypothetical protein